MWPSLSAQLVRNQRLKLHSCPQVASYRSIMNCLEAKQILSTDILLEIFWLTSLVISSNIRGSKFFNRGSTAESSDEAPAVLLVPEFRTAVPLRFTQQNKSNRCIRYQHHLIEIHSSDTSLAEPCRQLTVFVRHVFLMLMLGTIYSKLQAHGYHRRLMRF